MRRLGYQALGFTIWNSVKWYMRTRYGNGSRKAAAGGLVALVLAGLLLGARRANNG